MPHRPGEQHDERHIPRAGLAPLPALSQFWTEPTVNLEASAQCPFCQRLTAGALLQNDAAIAFADGFPVSRGHTLVVPKRHVASVFELGAAELANLWLLVSEVRAALSRELSPDGFTIGVNDGQAAGQTVAHGHVHVIPRRAGDVPDPRGGVRWVVPAKAAYWSN